MIRRDAGKGSRGNRTVRAIAVGLLLAFGGHAQEPAGGYTIYAVPHSHIAIGWYWTYDKTQVICINILDHALNLLKKDPGYAFTQDQLLCVKPFWDSLSAGDRDFLRRAARAGRFEVGSGMYVQPEVTEPGFESLTRQFLLAKPWLEKTFDSKIVTGWNLDVFGNTVQMPQLFPRAGLSYFVFMRDVPAAMQESVKSPFYWKSPDGSSVLSYWLSGTYVGLRTVPALQKSIDHNVPGNDKILLLWGGDVSVPTEDSREIAKRIREAAAQIGVPIKSVVVCTARRYFEDVGKSGVQLPTYTYDFNPPLLRADLRGLYGQRPEDKLAERRAEESLESSEMLSSIAGFYGQPYPANEIRWGWERLLANQFHDTMGGSDTDAVHRIAVSRFGGALEAARDAMEQAMYTLSRKIDTSKGGDYPFLVFNSSSLVRSELVHTDILFKEQLRNFRIVDSAGTPVPFRLVSVSRRTANGPLSMAVVEFVAHQMPALGYRLYRVDATDGAPVIPVWHAAGDEISSRFFRLRLDRATGEIASLTDLRTGRELLDTSRYGGNELVLDEERNPDMEGRIHLNGKEISSREFPPDSIEEVADDLGVRIRVRGPFLTGRRTQEIALYDQVPRIDFRTQLEGFPGHDGMLSVVFALSGANGKNLYDTHGAVTERPDGIFDAQTWFDVQYPDRGVAFLNRGTGGVMTDKGVVKLTLLRSITNYRGYDSPDASEAGSHSFTYSLYPHAGSWSDGSVVEQGHSFNTPLQAMATDAHSGALPSEYSFLSIEGGHFEVTALKLAEQGTNLVLRGYESHGRAGEVRIKFNLPIEGASRADLLEQPAGEMPLSRQGVEFAVQPFEFVTLRLRPGRVP